MFHCPWIKCKKGSTSTTSSPFYCFKFVISYANLQASLVNVVYDDVYDVYGDVSPRGLSRDSLKELPCHVILDIKNATDNVCCTICLQVNFYSSFCSSSLPPPLEKRADFRYKLVSRIWSWEILLGVCLTAATHSTKNVSINGL